MPKVARFPGAALRELDPVWAATLRRVDGEGGVLQQLAEGEFEIIHISNLRFAIAIRALVNRLQLVNRKSKI